MAPYICADIAANISFHTSLNVTINISAYTTLNIPNNITPYICIDLKNPQLAVNQPKRDKLINFLDLRHSLTYQVNS